MVCRAFLFFFVGFFFFLTWRRRRRQQFLKDVFQFLMFWNRLLRTYILLRAKDRSALTHSLPFLGARIFSAQHFIKHHSITWLFVHSYFVVIVADRRRRRWSRQLGRQRADGLAPLLVRNYSGTKKEGKKEDDLKKGEKQKIKEIETDLAARAQQLDPLARMLE